MRSKEQGTIRQVTPCSRHTNSEDKPLLSKKTAYSLLLESDCHENYVVRSQATYNVILTRATPEAAEGLSPYSWLKQLKKKNTDKERYEISWDFGPQGETPRFPRMTISHFNMWNLSEQYNTFGRCGSAKLFHAKSSRKRQQKKLYHTRYTHFENAIKESGIVVGGFNRSKGRQTLSLYTRQPVGHNSRSTTYGLQALEVLPRRDLRCRHGASVGRIFPDSTVASSEIRAILILWSSERAFCLRKLLKGFLCMLWQRNIIGTLCLSMRRKTKELDRRPGRESYSLT